MRQLTEGHFYEHSLSFSPKGNEVLFISNREADPDRFFNYDIFTVGIGGGGETRRLTLTENAEYRAAMVSRRNQNRLSRDEAWSHQLRDDDGGHAYLGHGRGWQQSSRARYD